VRQGRQPGSGRATARRSAPTERRSAAGMSPGHPHETRGGCSWRVLGKGSQVTASGMRQVDQRQGQAEVRTHYFEENMVLCSTRQVRQASVQRPTNQFLSRCRHRAWPSWIGLLPLQSTKRTEVRLVLSSRHAWWPKG
jgi:hypothetical protein